MVRHAIVLGIAALGIVSITARRSMAGEALADRCPQYPAHLRIARAYLARSDSAAAIAELRRADEALGSCLREEAAGNSLLARHGHRIRAS